MVRIIQSLMKKYGNDSRIFNIKSSTTLDGNYFAAYALFWNNYDTFCSNYDDQNTFLNIIFPNNILKVSQIEIKTNANFGFLSSLELYATGDKESFAKVIDVNKPMCSGKMPNCNCLTTTVVPVKLNRPTYLNGIKIHGIGKNSCNNNQLCITGVELIGEIIKRRTCYYKIKHDITLYLTSFLLCVSSVLGY